MKVAITGHRPERIVDVHGVRSGLLAFFTEHQPELVIQGMAAGVDLWSAAEAWRAEVPYLAVRPWAGHKPRKDWANAYEWVLAHALEVVSVIDAVDYPGPHAYEMRNRWMIDRADLVLAVWDGKLAGGTYNAISYATGQGKRVVRIDPNHPSSPSLG